jgi:putative ABC transport system permease protein
MTWTNRTPLAWWMLVHRKGRLAVSLAGVAFAATLMFVEMGFLNGLFDSQTHVIEVFDADLIMVNRIKESVVPHRPFPRQRLQQVLAHPQVAAAHPLYMEDFLGVYKSPPNHREHAILVFGINPEEPAFLIPEAVAQAALLKQPDTALLDSQAKPFYGHLAAGVDAELAHRTIHIVGTFPLGADFRIDGNLIISEQTFFKYFADPHTGASPADRVEFGLIKVAPGADPGAVRDALAVWLPDDVVVLTKQGFIDRVRNYWATNQPVGFVFGLGMVVGFVIGVTICYQILFSDVVDHLPQYATLKAMGYSNSFLVGVVIREGAYLGVLGFLPGLAVSVGAYATLHAVSGMRIQLTPGRIALVFVLTVLMCVLSGVLAVRRAVRADPAEVFA